MTDLKAQGVKGKVEYLLMRLKQRLIHPVPPDHRIVEFLQNNAVLPEETLPNPFPQTKPLTLAALFKEYLELHSKVLDERTVKDMRGHCKHLARLLGEDGPAADVVLSDLQRFVIKRVGEGVEGATAKKEVITLRTVWNRALRMNMLTAAFPNRGLRFPKGNEKPPFMTFAEVQRRVAGGAGRAVEECVPHTPGDRGTSDVRRGAGDLPVAPPKY